MSVPVSCLNISPARWIVVPEPDEAMLYLPGFAFKSAISSGTVFAGTLGWTTSMLGHTDMPAIGEKSFTGS